jgi:ethanolamine utilization protein EutN
VRVADVIGDVTLSRRLPDVPAGRFILVQPLPLSALDGGAPGDVEPLVAYDDLSAGLGTRVGFTEGREAAMPFHPRLVPFDAYCAAILDAGPVDRAGEV